jgi:hypothetical protein
MDNSLASYWRLWSSFLVYTSLQQHCMKVVVDNNLRYACLTNHFCIYFCMVITTSYCYIIISASLFFFNLNFNFFINLFRLQWCKHVCPSILLKRILIFKFIMSSLSIKMSRSPQQNVTFMHWTTSHRILSTYFWIENGIKTCLVTFISPQSFNNYSL